MAYAQKPEMQGPSNRMVRSWWAARVSGRKHRGKRPPTSRQVETMVARQIIDEVIRENPR